jgi:hypothetical protein
MSDRLLNRVRLALLLVGLLTAIGAGQSRPASSRTAPFQDPTASLSGTLVDSLNQPVSAANVSVTSDELGIERRAQTDDEGYFYIPFLQPGTYTLLIEMSGFGTIRVSGLALQSGMNSALSLTLNPKGAKEVIDVKATPSRIDASNATIKYTVTNKQIESFPLIATTSGRSILESLPLFLPGISPALSSGVRGEGLVVNGARPLSNSFSIEGGDDNDYELNRAAAPFPNPDALQEVTVLTNNYKADVGGAAGAVIDATVKPGTNRFHGNLRYLVEDAALAASGFFHLHEAPDRLSSFGGQIGGPVLIPGLYNGRDRTHFFFDAEDNFIVQASAFLMPTLSMAERTGNFSNLPPYDPNSLHQPVDPLTGRLFPGGIIPPDRFDPIARYYLNNVLPVPDQASVYQAHSRYGSRNRQYTARIDQVLGDRDNLTGVLFANRNEYFSALSGGQRFQEYDLISHSLNVVAHETHTLSAASVNEVTATFARFPDGTSIEAPGIIGIQPSQAGFTGLRAQNAAFLALPVVSFSYFYRVGTSLVYNAYLTAGVIPGGGATKTTMAVKDDLIRAFGKHIVKVGGGTRFFILDRFGDPYAGPYAAPRNGNFGFGDLNPYGTGNPVADFLIGRPSVYAQSTGLTQHLRQRPYSFYVMDDWRLRPTLTLNLGLRYELTPPLTDAHNQAMAFRPGTHSSILPSAPEGLLFPGDRDPVLGTVPPAGYRTTWTDLGPRLGVAYSPRPRRGWLHALFGDTKSAVRAGFGMFYSPTYGFDSSKPSRVAPFTESLSFEVGKHGSFANPFGRQSNPFPLLPGDVAFNYSIDLYTFDPHFRTAYTYQYNLSIQRELPGSMLLELQYVGSNSFRLDREFDDNPYFLNPTASHPTPAYPQFGHIYVQKSDGQAAHDSFQTRLSRKFKTGLMLDMSYVFSKSLDNSSGPTFDNTATFSFANDLAGFSEPYAWGRSEFDRKHAFVAFYAYDLPTYRGRGLAGLFLNRWQIGGITQLRSGRPLDIQGTSLNGRPNIVGPFRRLDPRQLSTFTIDGTPVKGNFLFDPTVFSDVDPNSRVGSGNLGRNVFSGPGLNLTSFSIAKRSRIYDSQEIEIRADVTNVFNHTNFDPNSVSTKKGVFQFGQVQSALPGRDIQLSIRYKF